MNLKNKIICILSACAVLCCVPVSGIQTDFNFTIRSHAASGFVPKDAVASVTVNNETSYYYDTTTSGGAAAMWNTAMSGSSAMVILYQDWESSYGTRLGTGTGFAYDGVLCVPSGHEITIDLNGCHINRNLEFAIENGEVIRVQSGGILNLTDTNTELGNSGQITGGNSLDGAGGIYIESGGTVNLWGGHITGNQTQGSGGGVLLVGEDSSFNMSGGSITGNTANQCGGGVALSGGSFKFTNGTISENRSQSGGGIYAQDGSVEISGGNLTQNVGVHGGGILVNNSAELVLRSKASIQGNIASGENRIGGGILAMCTKPIRVSGDVNIIDNSADGVQSNLVFWKDSETDAEIPCYLQNAGLNETAKIGVSLSGKQKNAVFAPSWTGPACFICDAMDYEIKDKEGNMELHRVTSYAALVGDKKMLSIIVVGVLVALAFIAVLILAFKRSNQPGKSKKSSKSQKSGNKKKVKVKKSAKKPVSETENPENQENQEESENSENPENSENYLTHEEYDEVEEFLEDQEETEDMQE
ncbi:MAG: hypothetical protein K2O42_02425 [Oscillospiraceae bacterium]|nr:hypothetical protein [Oscillospiraceae bacterium]